MIFLSLLLVIRSCLSSLTVVSRGLPVLVVGLTWSVFSYLAQAVARVEIGIQVSLGIAE